MGGFVLCFVVIAGLVVVARWERGGGRVPTIPDVELPAHGMTALAVGLALAFIALTIVAIDLSLIWLRVR